MSAMDKNSFVIENARIIDPAQNLDKVTNIVVIDGVVHNIGGDVQVATDRVFDGTGYIVTPGWIDIHIHCYEHSTPLGLNADRYCLARGVTAAVDAGSAGGLYG